MVKLIRKRELVKGMKIIMLLLSALLFLQACNGVAENAQSNSNVDEETSINTKEKDIEGEKHLKEEQHSSNNQGENKGAEEKSIYPKSSLNKVDIELLNNNEDLTSRVEKIHDYVGIEYVEDELSQIAQSSKYNELNPAVKQFVQENLYEEVERTEKIGENAVMVITKNHYVFKLLMQYNEEYDVWLVNAVGAL